MSLRAYQQTRQVTETHRDTEYRLFAQITRNLMAVKEKPRHDPEVIDAVHRNRRLWSVLMNDCSDEGNKLPEETRAGIISIAIWVDTYSSEVMRDGKSIDPLVDVNRTVMEGLAASPGQAT